MNNSKRVNIFNKQSLMIMRVSKEFAIHGVKSGLFAYTTKGALKKYMKRDMKIKRNERFIESMRVRGNNINTFKSVTGRVYTIINGHNKQYSNYYGGRGQVLVTQFE